MKRKDRKQVVKSFVRIAVDGCLLPGTMMGTELTWLYVLKWKREASALCIGLLSLIYTTIDLPTGISQLQSVSQVERDL